MIQTGNNEGTVQIPGSSNDISQCAGCLLYFVSYFNSSGSAVGVYIQSKDNSNVIWVNGNSSATNSFQIGTSSSNTNGIMMFCDGTYWYVIG